jgi:hypothetical protein
MKSKRKTQRDRPSYHHLRTNGERMVTPSPVLERERFLFVICNMPSEAILREAIGYHVDRSEKVGTQLHPFFEPDYSE